MTYTQEEIRDFGSRLSSIGGRLGYEKSPANQCLDIEDFFTVYNFPVTDWKIVSHRKQ
jgi:hypothetical protein